MQRAKVATSAGSPSSGWTTPRWTTSSPWPWAASPPKTTHSCCAHSATAKRGPSLIWGRDDDDGGAMVCRSSRPQGSSSRGPQLQASRSAPSTEGCARPHSSSPVFSCIIPYCHSAVVALYRLLVVCLPVCGEPSVPNVMCTITVQSLYNHCVYSKLLRIAG